jgi:hypothetical protein
VLLISLPVLAQHWRQLVELLKKLKGSKQIMARVKKNSTKRPKQSKKPLKKLLLQERLKLRD